MFLHLFFFLFKRPALTCHQTVPEKYAKTVCHLIGLNTLRGLTILHSSGDEGMYGCGI